MITRFFALAVLVLGTGGAICAQSASNADQDSIPTNSPEPLTVLALAGGAAVAGGVAYRKRRRSQG